MSFRRTILAEDLKTIFNFEEQWMFDFPIDRGAISNKRNYDDAFLLSSPQLHVKKISNYMNSKQSFYSQA